MSLLEVKNLELSLSDRLILKDISFKISENGLWHILGPNGVGKSALLKCVMNIFPKKSGEIQVHGRAVESLSQRELSQNISYLSQEMRIPTGLTVSDYVQVCHYPHMETFRSLTKFEEERVCYFFDQLKVESSWDFPLGHLSGGRRQLVRLSCALARPCPIVFLDEPLNSLDPLAQDDAMKVIQEVAREKFVLAITHSINHSLQSNGNFLGLRNGGLAFKGSRQELETTKGLDLLFSRSFTWGEIDGVRVVR